MTARAKLRPAPVAARVAEIPLTPQPPALVLLGRGAGHRPRAAWFEAADVEGATVAAVAMGLTALPLTAEADRRLATQLPRGRMLASGRALVPFADRDLCARLIVLADAEADHGSSEDKATPQLAFAASPNGPALTVASEAQHVSQGLEEVAPGGAAGGAAVASVDGAAETEGTGRPPAPRPGDRTFVGHPQPSDRADIGLGSMVLAHEGPDDGWWEAEVIGINGATLSLRWCDFPAEPTILRKAGELALLPPGEP